MKLIQCILTDNDCFRTKRGIKPKGVMVHSTGADNPTLRRYVQPVKGGDGDYAALMAQLGRNKNGNHWNRPGLDVCVHGFIGQLADGSVASVQTLPWTHRGWHAGTGTSGGSANNTHISFEICEDGLTDPTYFKLVYREAVELTAHLCQVCGLDPLADGVVICHSEGWPPATPMWSTGSPAMARAWTISGPMWRRSWPPSRSRSLAPARSLIRRRMMR